MEPEQKLGVAGQAQGIDLGVSAGPVAGQHEGADLEPVSLGVREGQVVPAGGDVDDQVLVVVAHPDVPLLEAPGRLPRAFSRLPSGQLAVETDLAVERNLEPCPGANLAQAGQDPPGRGQVKMPGQPREELSGLPRAGLPIVIATGPPCTVPSRSTV